MRFLKWGLFFIGSFLVAWIIIFTFIQEPFREAVAAKILAYETPKIPIYYYLIAALGTGLVIGLSVALYYYIMLSARLHRQKKRIDELVEETDFLKNTQGETEPSQQEEKISSPSSAKEVLSASSREDKTDDSEGFLDETDDTG